MSCNKRADLMMMMMMLFWGLLLLPNFLLVWVLQKDYRTNV